MSCHFSWRTLLRKAFGVFSFCALFFSLFSLWPCSSQKRLPLVSCCLASGALAESHKNKKNLKNSLKTSQGTRKPCLKSSPSCAGKSQQMPALRPSWPCALVWSPRQASSLRLRFHRCDRKLNLRSKPTLLLPSIAVWATLHWNPLSLTPPQ